MNNKKKRIKVHNPCIMEFEVPNQFEQMCRACMCSEERILQSIFDYVDTYKNSRIQVYELLNMTVQNLPKIEIMDALPKNLCSRCVEKLCAFYEFQNCCINSDQHLRKLIVTSIVQGTKTNSEDPLQSDLSEIENFIKQEIVEKDVENFQKNINGEHFNENDGDDVNDYDYNGDSGGDYEEEKDENIGGNEAVEKDANNDATQCEICKKTFLYKRNLMRHMQREHDFKNSKSSKSLKKRDYDSDESDAEEAFFCDFCDKSFSHKKNLQRHMKRAHKIESNKGVKQVHSENLDTEGTVAISTTIEPVYELGSMESKSLVKSEDDLQAEKSDVERVYLCELCETEFSYKKNLKRHMKRAHDFEWPKDILMESDAPESNVKKAKKDNRTWTCEICKTQFLYKRNLRRHMKRTHNEESPIEIKTGIEIVVDVAKQDKKSDSESTVEEWNIPKINIWTCERCQKKFTLKKNLKRHMKHIHNEDLLNDGLQKLVSTFETTETGDENASAQAEIFKCNECDKVFHKKVYLRKHKYRHKRPGGLKKETRNCDVCGTVFKTLLNLREHYVSAHPDRIEAEGTQLIEALKLYICQYCNKSFNQSCTLKDHLRVHTKEQPFLCSQCGKAFNSNSNLKQHIMRHETEKRYECPECPKKFPCLSDLASHKQVHKQLKPHVCDICNAAFGKPYQLKTHKMYHNGDKRYQCEYCAMRFVCGDHLRRHIRTHTGEKPYKCKYCPRSFSQSNDMIKHLRTHLGENVYQCELCPAAFRLATELRTHFAVHKNDDEETKKRNKLAWEEAQEQLKRKLETESSQTGNTRAKGVPLASENLLPQGGNFLLSLDQQV